MPATRKSAKPLTAAAYLASLSPDRRRTVSAVRKLVKASMPKGYEEFMAAGMLVWGIPLSVYPDTYNGHALWYVALASEKSYLSLHLMACSGSSALAIYLKDAYKAAGKRFDMGKACLHFETVDDLVPEAVEHVIAAVPVDKFLAMYELSHPPKKAAKRAPAAKTRAAARAAN